MTTKDDSNKPRGKKSERRTKARRLVAKRREKMRWELKSPIRRKNPGRRSLDRPIVTEPRKRSELISSLINFWVLTPTGQLGSYNENREFQINTKLSEALVDYTSDYLKVYQADPTAGNQRIAIICQRKPVNPWGAETLIMEESIVRRLYPVSGQTKSGLTTFQKKHRESSIYRGMELLLEWHDDAIPNIPIFCPVLYDRETTLNDYRALAESEEFSASRGSPVIEVLNLISLIPVHRRNATEILQLIRHVHERIVKKELRKPLEFEIVNTVNARSGYKKTISFASNEFNQELPEQPLNPKSTKNTGSQPKTSAVYKMTTRPDKQHEAWLEIPNCQVDVESLKKFLPFQHLDGHQLTALAARSPVYQAPPGALLLDEGSTDTWNMYLLKGRVSLESSDGEVVMINSDSVLAEFPVAFVKPRRYSVRSVTTVTFLWINDALIPNKP